MVTLEGYMLIYYIVLLKTLKLFGNNLQSLSFSLLSVANLLRIEGRGLVSFQLL
jgi:hypothetical protein